MTMTYFIISKKIKTEDHAHLLRLVTEFPHSCLSYNDWGRADRTKHQC